MCVASALLDAGAYLIDTSLSPEEYYTWKSGVRAPCYCNCRNAISDFGARSMIADEMSESVVTAFGDVDAVLGVSTAGIPWASCVADRLELATAYIRSEKKAHGVGGCVQGHVQPGDRVVIIDDLVASGGSLKMAIDALNEEADVEVAGVVSIINWGFQKMRDNLDGLTYVALTSYPQIIMAATARGKVNEADVSRLLNFYMNPLHIPGEAYPSEPGLTTCWVCGCRRQDVRLMFCHAQPLEIRPPDVPRRLRGALSR